jgi:hypothetical protein
MAPSRHEQDELHSAVLAVDPTAPARAFESLLAPLIERLRFKRPRRPRRDFEEQAIDSILSYLERPERYEPEHASLLTYLTMHAHGDLLNAYEKEAAGREKLVADVCIGPGRRASRSAIEAAIAAGSRLGTPGPPPRPTSV